MAALKVGVAMSGGVDSTMAASLLMERGYEVHGFFMQLPLNHQEALETRARQVAAHLNIPLTLVDLRQQFLAEVIGYFTKTYQAGLTPNPCIHCNRMIKFGLLAQAMRAAGMEQIATGHYARLVEHRGKRWIARGQDPVKDQSYFLARLSGDQLQHLNFPLGGWSKEAIYERAGQLGFSFSGEESQDVCFLEEDLASFLAQHGLGQQSGPVQTLEGKTIGEHHGVWRYTIGQRRGLGLPDATPWYVVALDGPGNRVIVGKNDQLFSRTCTLHSLLVPHEPPKLPWSGQVQLRSRHKPALATLHSTGADQWQLCFENPQRAMTPGQFAVLYEEDRVIASGIIAEAHQEKTP
ncbi:tRNA 2-thiouridine(34) synthase MnmA [Desulfobulbus rhabdoformis]|uniref:tRNA 2-thiouridine(34) synthase MnmA n=1 Tax=Desulfobulbus rhabdoformis TaxID=34032 RepID=UPI001963ECDA|nr:tRNA 2-thiouridine(34) synthase MnmA [Desulfobulbus rhabdoformis]MBM9613074.1 tRNA 2-thiouridine(34) synthase MnmA [Desulfobulbus rhabdoformis]